MLIIYKYFTINFHYLNIVFYYFSYYNTIITLLFSMISYYCYYYFPYGQYFHYFGAINLIIIGDRHPVCESLHAQRLELCRVV